METSLRFLTDNFPPVYVWPSYSLLHAQLLSPLAFFRRFRERFNVNEVRISLFMLSH